MSWALGQNLSQDPDVWELHSFPAGFPTPLYLKILHRIPSPTHLLRYQKGYLGQQLYRRRSAFKAGSVPVRLLTPKEIQGTLLLPSSVFSSPALAVKGDVSRWGNETDLKPWRALLSVVKKAWMLVVSELVTISSRCPCCGKESYACQRANERWVFCKLLLNTWLPVCVEKKSLPGPMFLSQHFSWHSRGVLFVILYAAVENFRNKLSLLP